MDANARKNATARATAGADSAASARTSTDKSARTRSIALIAMFGVVLFSVLVARGLGMIGAGDALPSWTNVGVQDSLLEGRPLAGFTRPSAANVLDGSFQSGTERYLIDHIPLRDGALLGNAALQRTSIAQSATLCGYACYPTFFGSQRVYVPATDALLSLPSEFTDKTVDNMRKFARGLADVAKRYPTKRFFVLVPASAPSASLSPLSTLTSDYVANDDFVAAMEEELDGLANVFVGSDVGQYKTNEEFYQAYYRTDHHWTIQGAANLYNILAQKAGLPAFTYGDKVTVQPAYVGSHARIGLDAIAEEGYDLEHDFGDLTIDLKSGDTVDGNDHESFYAEAEDARRYGFYEDYFTFGSTYYGPGDKTALMLSDSYGYGIGRIIGQNYKQMHRCIDLYHSCKKGNLADEIDSYGADDIYFVGLISNYCSQTIRIPDYFE